MHDNFRKDESLLFVKMKACFNENLFIIFQLDSNYFTNLVLNGFSPYILSSSSCKIVMTKGEKLLESIALMLITFNDENFWVWNLLDFFFLPYLHCWIVLLFVDDKGGEIIPKCGKLMTNVCNVFHHIYLKRLLDKFSSLW